MTQSPADETGDLSRLKKSLTLYASFDKGLDADLALGDARLYSTKGMKNIKEAKPGLGQADRVKHVETEGVRGSGALLFEKKGSSLPFFKAEKNVPFKDKDWDGTVSFWLKTDPASNLGYNDPIQVTDASYKDSAIWVDFTKKIPRTFRLAVICDKESNKKDKDGKKKKRVSTAKNLPFSGDVWTHVIITFSALNTDHGESHLYFNGELEASVTDVNDPFTIDLFKFRIHLGMSYVGMLDELAAFDRSLSPAEVKTFHELKGGASDLVSKVK